MILYIYIFFFKENNKILKIKGGITATLLLTFLVYNVLLLPKLDYDHIMTFRNFTLHYIVPILAYIDMLLYDNINYNFKDVLYWCLFPLTYCFLVLFKGIYFAIEIKSEKSIFPYFFLDVYKLGYLKVFELILLISIIFIIISYFVMVTKKTFDKYVKKML